MVKRSSYQVGITVPAQKRYRDEILVYLLSNFSTSRAIDIDEAITNMVSTLSINPNRGTLEKYIDHPHYSFRFILYKETRNLTIKIIYYIDEPFKKVYITDFFPVLMNPSKINDRS